MRRFNSKPSVLIAAVLAMTASAEGNAHMTDHDAAQDMPATQTRRPELQDLNLSPSTTLDDVIATWGPPTPFGPAGAIKAYYMASGEEVWLSFANTGRVARAIVRSGDVMPTSTVLFDELTVTRQRQWEQLDFSGDVAEQDVDDAWGPPDAVFGSGIDSWFYALADGQVAVLWFDEGRVVSAERASGAKAPAP
jgi:hypothetical protein